MKKIYFLYHVTSLDNINFDLTNRSHLVILEPVTAEITLSTFLGPVNSKFHSILNEFLKLNLQNSFLHIYTFKARFKV